VRGAYNISKDHIMTYYSGITRVVGNSTILIVTFILILIVILLPILKVKSNWILMILL